MIGRDTLHTADSAAELLGVRSSTIRWWWTIGRLPRTKIGRLTRVRESEVLALLDTPPARDARSEGLAAFNVAVFAHGSELALVHLEADASGSAATEAAARGYGYIGCIGVNGGVPRVEIEPGHKAMMASAGLVFAGMLGEHVKAHQLARAAAGEPED